MCCFAEMKDIEYLFSPDKDIEEGAQDVEIIEDEGWVDEN